LHYFIIFVCERSKERPGQKVLVSKPFTKKVTVKGTNPSTFNLKVCERHVFPSFETIKNLEALFVVVDLLIKIIILLL